MPVIPVPIEQSTVVASALVVGVCATAFARAVGGLRISVAVAIGIGVSLMLINLEVVPIGLIVVAIISVLGALFRGPSKRDSALNLNSLDERVQRATNQRPDKDLSSTRPTPPKQLDAIGEAPHQVSQSFDVEAKHRAVYSDPYTVAEADLSTIPDCNLHEYIDLCQKAVESIGVWPFPYEPQWGEAERATVSCLNRRLQALLLERITQVHASKRLAPSAR